MTLDDAQTEAHIWVASRKDAILARVLECVQTDPRLCHTAWAAADTPNTLSAHSSLQTVTLDDPGRLITTRCGSCYVDEGKFSQAGISIPATAPINFKVNVFKAPGGWGGQVVIEIQFEGIKYHRAYGIGVAPSFGWQEVV